MIKIYYTDDIFSVSPEIYSVAEAKLPPERFQKAVRYRRQQDRMLCGSAYFLLKYAVRDFWHLEDVPEICSGTYGKPFFRDKPSCFFNYSHCSAGICCAVSTEEVGADMQNTESCDSMQYVMTEQEQQKILSSPNPDAEFTKLWAVKESYYKMLGTGLCEAMKEKDFSFLHSGMQTTENCTVLIKEYPGFCIAVFSRGKHQVQIEHVSLYDCIR
ncbi:MAG: 4'-phosphopantetheinyl transferase superfamily protein [Ruminococcus sp.]|nr:4'-phosphopantetheinyl transferase superfamily protein [Ruminococcus sp.]